MKSLEKKLNHQVAKDKLRKINLSWNEFNFIASNLLSQIKRSGIKIDCIISNIRGGLPLAVYLAHHLNVGTKDFGTLKVQRHSGDTIESDLLRPSIHGELLPDIKNRNVLIVEDTIGTEMASLRVIVNHLQNLSPKSISATAMFIGAIDKDLLQIFYYHQNTNPLNRQWVIFPWEVKV